jgi:hypothetical protein
MGQPAQVGNDLRDADYRADIDAFLDEADTPDSPF